MPGSLEFVQWNACVHRLDLSLYSHPKEGVFLRKGVRTHVNSKGKIPSTGHSEEGQTCDAASLRVSYSGPRKLFQLKVLPRSVAGPSGPVYASRAADRGINPRSPFLPSPSFTFTFLHLSHSLADRWGTTVDSTANFLHSSQFSAFRSMFHSRPVHSLTLSSHRFLCLPLRLPP